MTRLPDIQAQIAVAHSGAWVQSLPVDLSQWLLGSAESRSLSAGQRLFGRGDPPDGLYCVTRGTVRITGLAATGDEALLAMLDPPNWFGEIALFDSGPRTHDAWAESDVALLRVGQEALERRLASSPGDWRHFGRLLTQKLRVMFVSIEDIALLPPTSRVARRLAAMASGYGAWNDRSARLLRVSQGHLALMLSLSRQTVNQSLKELEAAGAIQLGRGAIEILDVARLAQPEQR